MGGGRERAGVTHDGVMKMVDEMSSAFVEKIRAEVEDPGEHFGVFRRALERGMQRIDTYGDLIVNQPKPESDAAIKDELEMLYSGIIQCAVAACSILEGLPDIPVSGFSMMTSNERN